MRLRRIATMMVLLPLLAAPGWAETEESAEHLPAEPSTDPGHFHCFDGWDLDPPPLHGFEGPSTGITITREFFQRLPGWDHVPYAFSLVPGVHRGWSDYVRGGSGMDNLHRVDGIPAGGLMGSSQVYYLTGEFIESIRVLTGGLPAEYGGVQGGVEEIRTRDRFECTMYRPYKIANQFKATLRGRYIHEGWSADDRRTLEGTDEEERRYWEPLVFASGPIIQDRIWLAAGYRRVSIDGMGWAFRDSAVWDYYYEVPTQERCEYPFAKLTLNPSIPHSIEAVWSRHWHKSDIVLRDHMYEAIGKRDLYSDLSGLSWEWLINASTLLDVRLGRATNDRRTIPADEDRDSPPVYHGDDYVTEGNYEQWYEDRRSRTSLTAVLDGFHLDGWIASDWKAGLELQRLARVEEDRFPGGESYVHHNNNTWTREEKSPALLEASGLVGALFVQEEREVARDLRLSSGLRYEYVRYEDDRGSEVATFDRMLAPRLGASWHPRGKDRGRFFIFAGRYYGYLDLQVPSHVNPTRTHRIWRHPGDGTDTPPDPDDPGWELEESWQDPRNTVDPDLEPEHTDEALLGWEREVLPGISLGLTAVRRWTRNLVEDVGIFVDDETGQTYDAYDLRDRPELWDRWSGPDHLHVTNVPGGRRDYRGLELQTHGSRRSLDWIASYTYAVTEGSVEGTHHGGQGPTRFSVYHDTPSLTRGLYGPLTRDSTHTFKLAGVAHLPGGLHLGVQLESREGSTFSRRVPVEDGIYGTRYQLDGGRGRHRHDWLTWVDLSLQQEIDLRQAGSVTLVLDVFNLFDQQTSRYRYQETRETQPWRFGETTSWTSPRRWELEVRYAW